MSRSRVAAVVALILVPVAILGIVLASIVDDGGGSDEPAVGVAPAPENPARRDRQPAPSGTTPAAPGTGGASVPEQSLSVLDRGSPPKELGDKLDPASSDGTLALGELRGTPIVLNVWSADCLPCRGEARVLQSEWERLGPRGVLFLGLNVLDAPAAARRYRAEHDVTYPTVEEQRADTARALGARGVPETLFISKSGKIVGRVVGGITLAQVEVGVRAARTGVEIPTDQGGGQIPLR